MTVKFVTHELQTDPITVLGHVSDVMTVQGHKISRVGAIEGQEADNPAVIHINFENIANSDDVLVLMLNVPDALELGLQLVAMGIEGQSHPGIDEIRDRLSHRVAELDRTLQVAH